jgi:hypothetical protein
LQDIGAGRFIGHEAPRLLAQQQDLGADIHAKFTAPEARRSTISDAAPVRKATDCNSGLSS